MKIVPIVVKELEDADVELPGDFGDLGTSDEVPSQAPAAPLTLVCPSAWHGVPIPPRRWLATERIIANDAIILSGDGGGGKTTIALQLAVSVAGDLGDWLGATCEHGAVLFFSAEEPEEEMRRRLQSAARARGLEEHKLEQLHFHVAEPDNCLLGIGRPNGPVIRTPLFEALRAAAVALRPALIVVDSIAATFGGNQNDRGATTCPVAEGASGSIARASPNNSGQTQGQQTCVWLSQHGTPTGGFLLANRGRSPGLSNKCN